MIKITLKGQRDPFQALEMIPQLGGMVTFVLERTEVRIRTLQVHSDDIYSIDQVIEAKRLVS